MSQEDFQGEKYILYADDDREDQELFTEMLKEIDAKISLVCVSDGEDAIEFLENLEPGTTFPCLVLLDLNMPKLNGIETLKKIKNDSNYRGLPVIIFSTTKKDNDIDIILSLGAVDYVKKPMKYTEFENVVRRFIDHCEVVPQRER